MPESRLRLAMRRLLDGWAVLGVMGAVLALGLVFVHVPASLWAANTTEFHSKFGGFLVPGLTAAVSGVAACWAVLALLPATARGVVASVVSAIALLAWTYAFFLTRNLTVLNGSAAPMDFDTALGAWELPLGALAIAVLALLIARVRRMAIVSLAVLNIGLAAVTTATLHSAQQRRARAPDAPDSFRSLLRFSSRDNVMVVLLDGLQSDVAAAVFARDRTLASAFAGFQFYRDTIGVAPTTFLSVPAIHSGVEFQGRTTLADYFEEAVALRSFMSRFADAGYQTALINPVQGLCPDRVRTCATSAQILRSSGEQFTRETLRLLDLSLFRVAPIWLKRPVYDDGNWLFAGRFDASEEIGRIFEHNRLLAYIADRLTVDDGPPTMKLIHSLATHTPFVLNDDCRTLGSSSWEHMVPQAHCALLALAGLLDALRRANVYDQTEIAIVSDHGIGAPAELISDAPRREAWSSRSGYANPTFLLKPRGARGPLVEEPAEVYLPDLGATLCASSGACRMPGVPAGQALPGRPRRFLDYEWRDEFWALRNVPQVSAYEIRGPLRDPGSWHDAGELAIGGQ